MKPKISLVSCTADEMKAFAKTLSVGDIMNCGTYDATPTTRGERIAGSAVFPWSFISVVKSEDGEMDAIRSCSNIVTLAESIDSEQPIFMVNVSGNRLNEAAQELDGIFKIQTKTFAEL